jgi:hypothetical protein
LNSSGNGAIWIAKAEGNSMSNLANPSAVRTSLPVTLRRLFQRQVVLEFWLPYFICIFLYFYFFGYRFLKQDIVMGGDTQGLWSFFYWQINSLLNFHEFAWWDPTAYNGWPSYFYALSGFVSYLSPYSIPPMIIAFVGHAFGMSVNTFLILHKTVISHGLCLLAIMLIAREIIRHPLARFLPALLFTLSEISFHGFRDAVLYENMPPALFYLFGLIYYNNRRTPSAFLVFVFLTGAFLASLNYAFLQSSLYWTLVFTVLMLIFFPDLLGGFRRNILEIGETRNGKIVLALAALYCVSGAVAFFTPVWLNLGHVIRVSGSGPIPYDLSLAGDFNFRYISAWPAWTNFLIWAPLPELHDKILKFDPWGAGIDHRYLGMVTLPLMVAAIIRGIDIRYVLVAFLTFAICALFIVYTVHNLALLPIIERFPVLQNIRTMSNTMPREGPSIMIMLLAGLGLDGLMTHARVYGTAAANRSPVALTRISQLTQNLILAPLLIGILIFGVVLGLIGASPFGAAVRDSLSHMSIYLTASAALCLAIMLNSASRAKLASICVALLIVTFMDLTLSATVYWERGKVWFANQAVHRYPTPSKIEPIVSAEQGWPGSYRGIVHNLWGGPWYGIKTWLVLAYRPEWQPVLVNWDPQALMVKAYPSFQFYTNGKFVPFDTIKSIDTMPVPGERDWFELSSDGKAIEGIDGTIYPIREGLAGYVQQVDAESSEVRFRGWAIDEPAKKNPKRVIVFAGARMWADGSKPYIERADINPMGGDYTNSGFAIVAKGLPPEQRVGIRVFAILADGTARQLNYSDGYPFKTDGAPSNNPLRLMETVKRDKSVFKSFYIHDESAVLGLTGDGAAVKGVPVEVLKFSPNTVRVRVKTSSDGFMISNDNYDQFWTATIDGSSVPVYRANYTYKAVRLPAGEHIVEWRYSPWPVKLAWSWFYLVFIAFGIAARKWHRKNHEIIG